MLETIAHWHSKQLRCRMKSALSLPMLSINAEVCVKARQLFKTFDQLMVEGQRLRVGLSWEQFPPAICQTSPARHKGPDSL
jgi:hypothetical protein